MPPNHRILANGISVLLIHLFGDVPGPFIFGLLIDVFEHHYGMIPAEAYGRALSSLGLVLLLGAVFFLRAAWIGKEAKDYRFIDQEDTLVSFTRIEDNDAPSVHLLQ